MKPISINKLAQIINAELKNSSLAPPPRGGVRLAIDEITGVSTDSRTVKTGDCFFAIAGDKFDGHNFLDQVFQKGAACAVVSKDIRIRRRRTDKTVLKVADTIAALGQLAHYYRNDLKATVIAITGSVGKTTTRQIIYNCLSRHFPTIQSPKSFNNNIGLPLTILAAQPDTKIIVAELGSNHPGEIRYLAKIACPDIALVTNVHPAHLDGFGSIEAIAAEKSSIADGLRTDGMLIINADQSLLLDVCRSKKIKNLITFGIRRRRTDIQASNIELLPTSSRFKIEDTVIDLPLPGPGNCQNALAAWAVCSQLNIKLPDFAASLKELSAVAMRAEILQISPLTVINDCYNANPASMHNSLQILSHIDPTGNRRLVFICGDMNELGKDTELLHAELGRQIARSNIGLLITVGPFAQVAAQAAKQSAKTNIEIISYPDAVSACNSLQKFIKDTDIILVKGSRAVGLEEAVEKLKSLFGPVKSDS